MKTLQCIIFLLFLESVLTFIIIGIHCVPSHDWDKSDINDNSIFNGQIEQALYGYPKRSVFWDTMSTEWIPAHWAEVISFNDETQYVPMEILPKQYYVLKDNAKNAGVQFSYPIAPLVLDELQETLQEILVSDMFSQIAPISEISSRPDGLPSIGLLFLAEIRIQFLASLHHQRWEVKIISANGEATLKRYMGKESEVFRDRIKVHILRQISDIARRKLRTSVKTSIMRFGIQFATRVRFDIVCPSVLVKSVKIKKKDRTYKRLSCSRSFSVNDSLNPIYKN